MADERTANERTAEERTANERTANSNAVPCRGLPAQVPPSPWGGAGGGLHMKKRAIAPPHIFQNLLQLPRKCSTFAALKEKPHPRPLSKGEARVVTGKALSE